MTDPGHNMKGDSFKILVSQNPSKGGFPLFAETTRSELGSTC